VIACGNARENGACTCPRSEVLTLHLPPAGGEACEHQLRSSSGPPRS
jgi:hypothetical protein